MFAFEAEARLDVLFIFFPQKFEGQRKLRLNQFISIWFERDQPSFARQHLSGEVFELLLLFRSPDRLDAVALVLPMGKFNIPILIDLAGIDDCIAEFSTEVMSRPNSCSFCLALERKVVADLGHELIRGFTPKDGGGILSS